MIVSLQSYILELWNQKCIQQRDPHAIVSQATCTWFPNQPSSNVYALSIQPQKHPLSNRSISQPSHVSLHVSCENSPTSLLPIHLQPVLQWCRLLLRASSRRRIVLPVYPVLRSLSGLTFCDSVHGVLNSLSLRCPGAAMQLSARGPAVPLSGDLATGV